MHQEEYKGHTITVDTLERGNNWTATYQIDAGEIRQLGDHPLPSEDIVRQEAIGEARRIVDRM